MVALLRYKGIAERIQRGGAHPAPRRHPALVGAGAGCRDADLVVERLSSSAQLMLSNLSGFYGVRHYNDIVWHYMPPPESERPALVSKLIHYITFLLFKVFC